MSSVAIARRAAGQVMRRRKADQLERFEALSGLFAERHDAARLHDAPRLEPPDWDERRPRLETELLPRPQGSFLRQPELADLVALPTQAAAGPELRWLSEQVSASRLPLLLEEDPIGSPPLLPVEGQAYLTSARLVDDLHHVARFTSEVGVDPRELDLVVEWGGGYGSLARLFSRLNGDLAYVIVDAPLMSCLQWLFLASVLGPERVDLCVEEPVAVERGRVSLVPHGLWHGVRRDADLFVSARGLSEASAAAQLAVAAGHWFGARHLLLSVPTDSPLSERAQLDGARASAVGPFLPGHEYVIR